MKRIKNFTHRLGTTVLGLLLSASCLAQQDSAVDNGYYTAYPHKIVIRAFVSQKFAPFNISSKNDNDLYYKTNAKTSLGLGATYKSLTLNLGYGSGLINKEKGKGKTKGLDLQIHIYPRKWAIDVLGVFLKGYYLSPGDNNGLNLTNYYLRPDIKRTLTGLSAFRVPNADKFSYKASVIHNEWQTRSAGSVLYGGEVYYGVIKGDSALVPRNVNNDFDQAGIKTIQFINIGPGIGYAYTLVMHKNFFISGSLIASAHVNFVSEQETNEKQSRVAVTPAGVYKGAIGYNSATWSVSANVLGNALFSASEASSKRYYLPTGNFRFTVARKIDVKRAGK